MAALLIVGIAFGVDKLQKHRAAKRVRLAIEEDQTARENYFRESKAAEAAASAERREKRRLDRRGSDGSLSSRASWEGDAVGPPRYEDVVSGGGAALAPRGNSAAAIVPAWQQRREDAGPSRVEGKGKAKRLWRKLTN